MSELFSIQLQNRQQQGGDGVWLDLPTTTEQVQVALRQIGISSDNPQGLFISGYFAEEEKRFAISYNMVLASNVDELNFLASRLETLSTGAVSYTHLESLWLERGPPDRTGPLQPLHSCFGGASQTGRPCVFQGHLRYPRREPLRNLCGQFHHAALRRPYLLHKP